MKYYQKQCWLASISQVFDTLSRTDGVLLSPAPGASSSSSVVSAEYYFIAGSIATSSVVLFHQEYQQQGPLNHGARDT